MEFKKFVYKMLHDFLKQCIKEEYVIKSTFEKLENQLNEIKLSNGEDVKEYDTVWSMHIKMNDGSVVRYTNTTSSESFEDLQSWFGKLNRKWYSFNYNTNGLPARRMFLRENIRDVNVFKSKV